MSLSLLIILNYFLNNSKLGQMVKFNNEIELDVWDGDGCNQLLNTDSTIFALFHDTKDLLWAFRSDLNTMGYQQLSMELTWVEF